MIPLQRAGYLAHARSLAFRRRLDEARRLIAAHANYAVSVSWGKDSTVLLHVAAHVRPDIAAVNARYLPEERPPDTDAVRDAVMAQLPHVRYAEVPCVGEWEMYERTGFFVEARTAAHRAAVRWCMASFLSALRTAGERLGADGALLGLRAQESRARAMHAARRGAAYTRQDGQAIALPLLRWRSEDIWAYLCLHDLPWLRMYDVAADRGRARSEIVFATAGTGAADAIRRHGAWLDWRLAYPEQFRAWLRRFPEIQRFL
jgi:3'-phosphoadenosine 5'-phosphosulfate sulfotransferase (PAPS reductase)/FAD synthetase